MSIWIIVYFLVLLSAVGSALYRFRVASGPDRLLILLLVTTIVHEASSVVIVMIGNRSNMPSFHIYSPLQLLITCSYFNLSSMHSWLRKTAAISAIGGLVAAIVNTAWLQPFSNLNSNFLLYEATTIIVLCLLTCYTIAVRQDISPFAMTLFWVTLCLLIYWSLTFATHGMRSMPAYVGSRLNKAVETVLLVANLLFYAGLALIFFFYTRLRPSGE